MTGGRSWSPVDLPDGSQLAKSLVAGSKMIVLATTTRARGYCVLLVRERTSPQWTEVVPAPGVVVKDFEVLPNVGVLLLCAEPAAVEGLPDAVGWRDFHLRELNLSSMTTRAITLQVEKTEIGPAALLGTSEDGTKLALAVRELPEPTISDRWRYRLAFVTPQSGKLELKEDLLGLYY